MIASLLDTWLVPLRPVRSTGLTGAESTAYEELPPVHAQRKGLSGGRSEEAGEHFPDYRADFIVRSAHRAIVENWRVRERGGLLYTVVAVVPNRRRGMNTLVCERVNE